MPPERGAEANDTMGSNDAAHESIDERRAFLRTLQNRDDVVTTDFTRDGFQTLYVQFATDTGFHKSLQDRARELGYSIEPCNGGVYRLSGPSSKFVPSSAPY